MRILDKYILKSVIAVFFSALLVFFFLYVIVDIFGHLDEFLREKVLLSAIRDYYISFMPIIFVQTAPVAFLLAVMFTFSSLNVNNEIIAMRSAGMDIWQLVKSTVFFACIISIVLFWVNEDVIPKAMQLSDNIKQEHIEEKGSAPQTERVNNLAFYGQGNRLFFIDIFEPKQLSMEGITILEQDRSQNLKKKIYALKASWKEEKWIFYNTQIFSYEKDGIEQSEFFKEKIMDISETPEHFLKQRIQVDYMNIKQLKDYILRLSDSGAKTVLRNLSVDIQQRFAYPFSIIVIMFVGLPFALMMKRRKGMTFASFGICIAVGFLYYIVNAVSIALGKSGLFVPVVSAWSANILFSATGLYLLKKIS